VHATEYCRVWKYLCLQRYRVDTTCTPGRHINLHRSYICLHESSCRIGYTNEPLTDPCSLHIASNSIILASMAYLRSGKSSPLFARSRQAVRPRLKHVPAFDEEATAAARVILYAVAAAAAVCVCYAAVSLADILAPDSPHSVSLSYCVTTHKSSQSLLRNLFNINNM